MTITATETKYLANTPPDPQQIAQWVEQFHRDGYLFIKNVLTPEMIARLKTDLDEVLGPPPDGAGNAKPGLGMQIKERMFETSRANLDMFDLEPIVTFAQTLIGEAMHVFHNNSFRTYPGGGITSWHQDDSPHYLVTSGEPPKNVRLPVLFFTCNYYLTNVETVEHGPTQVIPGSHLFGSLPPKATGAVSGTADAMDGTKYEPMITSCLGPAGSVVMFNNQVWHRGAPNLSDRTRYITQVSYGRRIISNMYFPFVNYVMPEHVYKDADERRKKLLGFMHHGAYG